MTTSVTAASGLSLVQMAQQAALDGRQQTDAATGQAQDTPMTIRALDQDAMHAARMKQMSILGNLSTKLRDVTSQLATSLHEIIAKRRTSRRAVRLQDRQRSDQGRIEDDDGKRSRVGGVDAERERGPRARDARVSPAGRRFRGAGAAAVGETFTDDDRRWPASAPTRISSS